MLVWCNPPARVRKDWWREQRHRDHPHDRHLWHLAPLAAQITLPMCLYTDTAANVSLPRAGSSLTLVLLPLSAWRRGRITCWEARLVAGHPSVRLVLSLRACTSVRRLMRRALRLQTLRLVP